MRKEAKVLIARENRDKGKLFLIREMPTMKAEKWAIRTFLALASSGVEIPKEVSDAGMAGIASLGIKALGYIKFQEAEPLLDEMIACVSIIPDPNNHAVVRNLVESDIDEVTTLLQLRKEVFELHTGFSIPGAPSGSAPGQESTKDQNSTGT